MLLFRLCVYSEKYLIYIALDNIKLYNVYMKYKSNNNVVYSCKYHVVFCPKYRRSVLINGVDVRLKELIKEMCGQLKVDIIEMEIMPNHVHIFIEVNPQYGIHKVIKQIKGYSFRILRQEFPWLKLKASKSLDKSLFCFYGRQRTTCRYKAVYRKPEKCIGGSKKYSYLKQ